MARAPDGLTTLLAERGPLAGGELARALGVSAATLSRIYARHTDRVCRMGKTRGVRYALRRSVRGLAASLPVYTIGSDGTPKSIGELNPLEGGRHWFEPAGAAAGPGILYEGLPPYCIDMAPQGFLGQAFSQAHPDLSLPERLTDWNDDHRLIAIARHGEDRVGDLIVGRDSLDRFLASEAPRGTPSYAMLATAAAAGKAGSSAGGEQPKFTAWDGKHHLIVKFTAGDGSPGDVRWRDLILCEALASAALASRHLDGGIGTAAESRWRDEGNRRFLESVRFDRIGARGRRGVLSLAAVADEWLGTRDTWVDAARRLRDARMIDDATAKQIRWLEAFGRLIMNSDRHFGNLGFQCDETDAHPMLILAPVYDMLPMRYAPTSAGVPPLIVEPPRPTADLLDVWPAAAAAARGFWQAVEAASAASPEFRRFAGEVLTASTAESR